MPGAMCDPSMWPPPAIASLRLHSTAVRATGMVLAPTVSIVPAGIGTTASVPGLGYPAGGAFYSPFGYGFYSPGLVMNAPVVNAAVYRAYGPGQGRYGLGAAGGGIMAQVPIN